MSLNANKLPSTKISRIPDTFEAGTYPARLRQVIDLGLQPQRPYKGEEKPPALELLTTYELVDEFLLGEDGEPDEALPINVSDRFPFYPLENKKAKSTSRYLSLDPTMAHGGDWARLVNTPCMVTVVINESNGKKYLNVQGITLPPKKFAIAPLVNPACSFDLDNPDVAIFDALPEWIKKIIREGLRFPGSKLARMLGEAEKDNKPAQQELNSDIEEVPEEAPW